MANALVVLSGGQDSTTCLALAKLNFFNTQAVFFNYGQRHLEQELKAAKAVCQATDTKLHILDLPTFSQIGNSALVDSSTQIAHEEGKLPNTFVPGRNIAFLTLAASLAYKIGAEYLYTGVCEADYSGYPACRENTMLALEAAINLGMESKIRIVTPLMHMSKADSVRLMKDSEHFDLLALTHTCYEGKFPPCEECPSCKLRQKGFDEAGVADPLKARKL